MVSFRFYLVSVTAIFLALALGITMGATVIKEATVSELRRQIRSAEANARATNQRDDQLGAQINQHNDFEAAAAPALVKDALPTTPIVIVASKAPDEGVVNALSKLLADAGAD